MKKLVLLAAVSLTVCITCLIILLPIQVDIQVKENTANAASNQRFKTESIDLQTKFDQHEFIITDTQTNQEYLYIRSANDGIMVITPLPKK